MTTLLINLQFIRPILLDLFNINFSEKYKSVIFLKQLCFLYFLTFKINKKFNKKFQFFKSIGKKILIKTI